jgi:hypothetical protein
VATELLTIVREQLEAGNDSTWGMLQIPAWWAYVMYPEYQRTVLNGDTGRAGGTFCEAPERLSDDALHTVGQLVDDGADVADAVGCVTVLYPDRGCRSVAA